MIEHLKEIPRLPQLSIELIKQTFQEDPDIHKISSIVQKEPALLARFFKTVNSASFGLRAKVRDINQAISIMGLNALKSTVASLVLGEYFVSSFEGKALNAKKFCIHSLAVGVVMEHTAKMMELEKADQLYLIGLLHDLGKIALDYFPNHDYNEVIEKVNLGSSIEEAEKEIYGIDHHQIWEELSEAWGFPPELIALYNGQVKGKVTVQTRQFVQESSAMADTLGYPLLDLPKSASDKAGGIFRILGEQEVMMIGKAIKAQVDAISEVIDLPSPNATQINENLLKVTHQLIESNAENERIRSELEFRMNLMEELNKVVTGIIRTLDAESLSFSVLEAMSEHFGADSAFLATQTKNGGFAGYMAQTSKDAEADVEMFNLDPDEVPPSFSQCRESKKPVKLVQPGEQERLASCLGDPSLAWVVPLDGRGNLSGMLGLGVRNQESLKFNSPDFGNVFQIVAQEVGLSLDNSRLYRRMRKEASTDTLTGIYNRGTVMKILSAEIARFKRRPSCLTVGLFDMDNFKAINDTRGHLEGDKFLKQVARVFTQGLRESDYIGRYGGDEFIALFPETCLEDATMVVERIRKSVLEVCSNFEGTDIGKKLSVSIGLAEADRNLERADDLVQLADDALYQAKAEGRNRVVALDRTPLQGSPR